MLSLRRDGHQPVGLVGIVNAWDEVLELNEWTAFDTDSRRVFFTWADLDRDGLVEIAFNSNPSLAEIMASFDDINALDDSRLRLWHFRGGFNITPDELRDVADFTAKQEPQPDRVAVVAAHDLGYGLLRMFQAYRAQAERADIRVFRSLEEAESFLLS